MENKLDYKKLGLKVGLEIHQQLEGKKLFCDCPTIIRGDVPDFKIKRYLRASAGETGEIDIAAKHEQKKEKYFVYEGYYDTTCLVETDEEPPHNVNKSAFYAVLQASLLMNCKIIDSIQFMRKIVVDGSNTSGFQRTGLVAVDGEIEVDSKKIRISTVCLEEDSCKNIKKESDHTIYRLDRLGIPLVEIGTMPDIDMPELAQKAAGHIGMILRSTGTVKRGLGTIRQDVNVSIVGGDRIEVKGVQDLKLIPTVVEYEATRQFKLLEIKKELEKRKFKPINLETINNKIIDVTEIMKNSSAGFIKTALDKGSKAIGIKIEKLKGIFGIELMPNYRFGSELADRARIFGFGGLIHSDEDLHKYKLNDEDVKNLNFKFKTEEKDGFIIVIGSEKKVKDLFIDLIIPRINYVLIGIPKEVRNSKEDGTSQYMRPMPDGARMYPETDVPIIYPDLENIKLPELIDDKIKRIEKIYFLNNELSSNLVKDDLIYLFEEIVAKYQPSKDLYNFIAEKILTYEFELKEIQVKQNNKNFNLNLLTHELLLKSFEIVIKNEISKQAMIDILYDVAVGVDFDTALSKYKTIDKTELKIKIKKIILENNNLRLKITDINKLKSTMLGICMGKLKTMALPKDISSAFDDVFE